MTFTEKLNDKVEKDLFQAISEQDVLTLRNMLEAIQDSIDQSIKSFEMNEMEDITN